ncbi:TIGR02569 family protein [Haloechinothrix aidingensis]|uniref:TIGR02569 family protein n=1 Tax=Haloechinothrix aidingensis TaxID=2752311 RepID=UPI0031B57523
MREQRSQDRLEPFARPARHICAAFGADPDSLEPAEGDGTWRSGSVVLRPVADQLESTWVARALHSVDIPDVRIARPLRATDGRQIIGGWVAYRDIAAEPGEVRRPRLDEVVLTSVKLHRALTGIPRPEFLRRRAGAWARADRMAWGEEDAELAEGAGGRWFEILAASARPVTLPDQLVHGDLYRSLRWVDGAGPVVLDFRPFYRPAEWATALVVVDAIAEGEAGVGLAQGWAHLPEWSQMLLRAMLFRLATHALDPDSGPSALDGLRSAAGIVSELV